MQGCCRDSLQALLRDIHIAQARGQTELLTELGDRVGSGQTGGVWGHTCRVDAHGLSNQRLAFRTGLKIEAHGVG